MKTKSLINSVLGVGAFLLVAAFAPTTFAQSGTQDQATPPAASQPTARAHEHGKSPFAGLNLSDDQKTQIKKIHEEARAKREKVMADSSLSDTAKQEKAKEIRHAAMEQVAQRADARTTRAAKSQSQSTPRRTLAISVDVNNDLEGAVPSLFRGDGRPRYATSTADLIFCLSCVFRTAACSFESV